MVLIAELIKYAQRKRIIEPPRIRNRVMNIFSRNVTTAFYNAHPTEHSTDNIIRVGIKSFKHHDAVALILPADIFHDYPRHWLRQLNVESVPFKKCCAGINACGEFHSFIACVNEFKHSSLPIMSPAIASPVRIDSTVFSFLWALSIRVRLMSAMFLIFCGNEIWGGYVTLTRMFVVAQEENRKADERRRSKILYIRARYHLKNKGSLTLMANDDTWNSKCFILSWSIW